MCVDVWMLTQYRDIFAFHMQNSETAAGIHQNPNKPVQEKQINNHCWVLSQQVH